jgi:hypothetical protein
MIGRATLLSLPPYFIALSLGGCTKSPGEENAAKVSESSATATHCVSTHIREAITLNTERKPLYAKVSSNRSAAISTELMTMEWSMLASLPLIELPARAYQKKGIPILCLDVVSMSETPAFVERLDKPTSPFVPFDGLALSKSLMTTRLQYDERKLEEQLVAALAELETNRRFNCLARHFVESILRSVRLLPRYRAMSREQGLAEPNTILGTYINSQIASLAVASGIDHHAAPLQSEGIPILCNDVPPIPTEVDTPPREAPSH